MAVAENGIFEEARNRYSKCYCFQDINYTTATVDEQFNCLIKMVFKRNESEVQIADADYIYGIIRKKIRNALFFHC